MQTDDKLSNNGSQKLLHLEIMRIVAIFWVIFNHTGSNGFWLFADHNASSFLFWLYLFISVFCKFPVPLFFAVSGSIMLNRPDESLKKTWLSRILKMVIILIIISLFYYSIDLLRTGGYPDPAYFFQRIYSSTIQGPLWYLYLYIAYLIILPFLRSMVKNLPTRFFYYLFILAIIFNGLIPVIQYRLSGGTVYINSNISVSWFLNTVLLYPCLGYFMQHRLSLDKASRFLPWLWGINILGIIATCYMTFYLGILNDSLVEQNSQYFYNCFVVLNCTAVFLTIRILFEERKIANCLKTVILSAGKCTFGIYLFHVFFLQLPQFDVILGALQATGINRMLCIFVMCLLVMAVSYLLTFILSKIPLIKKLVGF